VVSSYYTLVKLERAIRPKLYQPKTFLDDEGSNHTYQKKHYNCSKVLDTLEEIPVSEVHGAD
jgi:hypothetical protein